MRTPDFTKYTPRLAIGDHRCIVCGEIINKGSVYLGRGGAARIHLACSGLSPEEQAQREQEARTRRQGFGRRQPEFQVPLKQITVPMPVPLLEAAKAAAKSRGTALTALVRELLAREIGFDLDSIRRKGGGSSDTNETEETPPKVSVDLS